MSNVIQSSWPAGAATQPSTVTCIYSFSFLMTLPLATANGRTAAALHVASRPPGVDAFSFPSSSGASRRLLA
jgi:hypothetical protein